MGKFRKQTSLTLSADRFVTLITLSPPNASGRGKQGGKTPRRPLQLADRNDQLNQLPGRFTAQGGVLPNIQSRLCGSPRPSATRSSDQAKTTIPGPWRQRLFPEPPDSRKRLLMCFYEPNSAHATTPPSTPAPHLPCAPESLT